ncbi:2-(S)-hydroxypropyl dehydrogenase [Fusarium mundagurra]|uniref:2-(S)-hydroxypropyl dehydrogenase n=1 Tax=Fusarium mundagurra TaxID=1567541 RepID=A0A8H5YTY5_9HYPO|nr:2-(S)-hydroxypropyl dehydrogenase [Fusarium mundagurra]
MSEPHSVVRSSRSLKGKVAIVTGAGCVGEGIGNGRAAAILLAEDGCSVVCVDLNQTWADKTVEMIKAEGFGSAVSIVADVSKEAECKKIVDQAISTFGRLDILVNNVGIPGPPGNVTEVDMDRWRHAFSVNLESMILMARFTIPEMLKNDEDSKGSIVNLSSVAGLGAAAPKLLAYATNKGAIINLTKTMALEYGKQGIRVNCVAPGSVYTPLTYANPNIEMTTEMREARKSNNMLGIEGNGWDVGDAVRYVAGPTARWVTGVILPVDAGVTATAPLNAPATK